MERKVVAKRTLYFLKGFARLTGRVLISQWRLCVCLVIHNLDSVGVDDKQLTGVPMNNDAVALWRPKVFAEVAPSESIYPKWLCLRTRQREIRILLQLYCSRKLWVLTKVSGAVCFIFTITRIFIIELFGIRLRRFIHFAFAISMGEDTGLRLLEEVKDVKAVKLVVDNYERRDFNIEAWISSHKINHIVFLQARRSSRCKSKLLRRQADFLQEELPDYLLRHMVYQVEPAIKGASNDAVIIRTLALHFDDVSDRLISIGETEWTLFNEGLGKAWLGVVDVYFADNN